MPASHGSGGPRDRPRHTMQPRPRRIMDDCRAEPRCIHRPQKAAPIARPRTAPPTSRRRTPASSARPRPGPPSPSLSAAPRRPDRRAEIQAPGRAGTCCVRRAASRRSARENAAALPDRNQALRGTRPQHQDARHDHRRARDDRRRAAQQHRAPSPRRLRPSRPEQHVGEDAPRVVQHQRPRRADQPVAIGPHIWTQCRLLTSPRSTTKPKLERRHWYKHLGIAAGDGDALASRTRTRFMRIA